MTITTEDVSQARVDVSATTAAAKTPPAFPWWAKLVLAPLTLTLPLLAIVTIVLRAAMRNQAPRTRQAVTSYLCTLLVASGLLTCVGFTLFLFFQPTRFVLSAGLSDLDERATFPHLPEQNALNATQVGETFKPLVVIVSPERRAWFGQPSTPSGALGSGMLLYAGPDGYLFATAKHVVDALAQGNGHVMLSSISGAWAPATVVAHHKSLDAALVWIGRKVGSGTFCQPMVSAEQVAVGQPVFVIGHPEGLTFALSTGIVSRLAESGGQVQITAPISPGNSGGPVYDERGRLLGIVVSMVDPSMNAQNLNFAVRADALAQESEWAFEGSGKKRFEAYQSECGAKPAQ